MDFEARKRTILIVDDSPSNIVVLNRVLGSEYEVLFATNGQDALDIALEQAPDLILLDVVMPEMDGYEVCAKLKSDSRTHAIPVIFITAMDHLEDEEKGLNIGAIDYITRPVRPPIVRARVKNHLELKCYRDFLLHISSTDGLTGIPNRRCFDESLDREWLRAIRSRGPLSLIMMDIDYFKAFNDYYGHLGGDECLRKIAHALVECIRRPGDLVARIGGEEFACLLPDTAGEGAMRVAERLLEGIERLGIPDACSPISDRVTLSIGVAFLFPQVGQSSTDLVRYADEMLYRAKQSGRNQIVRMPDRNS